MNKVEQCEAIINYLWKVVCGEAEKSDESEHIALIVKLPQTPRQDPTVFPVEFPTLEEAKTEQAAKRIWQARCDATVQRTNADLLLIVSEAYLPPKGMEQEALAIQLAGGRVRDMPSHIEAITMVAETKWGTIRMIWRQILDRKLVGDVVDTSWQGAENAGGLFSGFFKKGKSKKERINP